MQKFFVKEHQINTQTNTISITGDDVNHIKNVLRYETSQKIEIGNNTTGEAYLCSVLNINKENIECKILEKIEEQRETDLHLHIIQGIPKSDKMELVIQKCTELGVKEFTPLELKNCVVKINKKEEEKKILRWQKIAEVAAKQCKRDIVPKINNVYNLKNIFSLLKEYDIVLLAYEEEKNITLKKEIENIKKIGNNKLKIAIIIGPEGGITKEEAEYMNTNNAKIVSLGKRILRTETVAFVISSIFMYELGDLA